MGAELARPIQEPGRHGHADRHRRAGKRHREPPRSGQRQTHLEGDGAQNMAWMTAPVTNALTIDLEDWYQGLQIERARWDSCEDRLAPVTDRLLALLDGAGMRATFFVPGHVAGRVAQSESARFTRERSLVRNQPRPPKSLLLMWSSHRRGER